MRHGAGVCRNRRGVHTRPAERDIVTHEAIEDHKIRDLCCNWRMTPTPDSLPNDIETLKAMLIAAHTARIEAEVKAQNAEAEARALTASRCSVPRPKSVGRVPQ